MIHDFKPLQKKRKKYADVPYYAVHFEHNNDHKKYKMNGQELMVTEVDTGVKVTKEPEASRRPRQCWDSYAEPSPTGTDMCS